MKPEVSIPMEQLVERLLSILVHGSPPIRLRDLLIALERPDHIDQSVLDRPAVCVAMQVAEALGFVKRRTTSEEAAR